MNKQVMQIEVNRLLNRGIVFGFIWIMGIGSVIAIISGFQANKIIAESGYILEGKSKAMRCIILGIAGLLIVLSVIVFVIIFRRK